MQQIKNNGSCKNKASDRRRRDAGSERFMADNFDGEDYQMSAGPPLYSLAHGHARWIQMELLPDCEKWGMKLLRRCDRWWRSMQFNYCKSVDSTVPFCANLKKKGDYHPKKWDIFQNDGKYGIQN